LLGFGEIGAFWTLKWRTILDKTVTIAIGCICLVALDDYSWLSFFWPGVKDRIPGLE